MENPRGKDCHIPYFHAPHRETNRNATDALKGETQTISDGTQTNIPDYLHSKVTQPVDLSAWLPAYRASSAKARQVTCNTHHRASSHLLSTTPPSRSPSKAQHGNPSPGFDQDGAIVVPETSDAYVKRKIFARAPPEDRLSDGSRTPSYAEFSSHASLLQTVPTFGDLTRQRNTSQPTAFRPVRRNWIPYSTPHARMLLCCLLAFFLA